MNRKPRLASPAKAACVVLILAGLPALLWALSEVAGGNATTDSGYLMLFAVSLGCALMLTPSPRFQASASILNLLQFTAILFYGPAPAALIAGTVAFLEARTTKRWLMPWLTNVSKATLSVLAAGTIYQRALALFWRPGAVLEVEHIAFSLLATALGYFVLESWVAAVVAEQADGKPAFRAWRELAFWKAAGVSTGAAAAGVIFFLTFHMGRPGVFLGMLACALILGAAHFARRTHLARLEERAQRLALMNKVHSQTVEALRGAIDAKGQAAHGHVRQVEALAVALAQLADAPGGTVEALRAAARFHEVGKLAVPDSILSKPGPLNQTDWKTVAKYPRIGAEILGEVEFPQPVPLLIRGHRERWDGSGVPDGLAGEQIPLGARILSFADCVVTMLSPRPWRPPLPEKEVLRYVQAESGRVFDPQLVKLFCSNRARLLQKARAVEAGGTGAPEELSVIQSAAAAGLGEVHPPQGTTEDAKARELESLMRGELAASLATIRELSATLDAVAKKLRGLLAFDTVVVYLLDEKSNVLRAVFADGPEAELLRGRTLERGEGATGWAVAHVTTATGDDAGRDLAGGAPELSERFHSVVVTPLVAGNLCVGAITLYSEPARRFSDKEERILEAVAAAAADAIRDAASLEESQRKAITDALTGLPNRRGLEAQLDEHVARCAAEGRSFGVVVVNLDRFRVINEAFGRPAGDEVLRAAAEALKTGFGGREVVCRSGGDGFAVLVPEADAGSMEREVRRAQRCLDGLQITISGGRVLRVGLSAGWAVFPEDGNTGAGVLSVANMRMYTAKAHRHETIDSITP